MGTAPLEGAGMITGLLLVMAAITLDDAPSRQQVLVVVGADGTPEYGEMFREWSARWELAAQQADAAFSTVGLDARGDTTDRDLLQRKLKEAAAAASEEPFWLVLIGHGTFDTRTSRFNLRGPDVNATQLAEWTKPIQRPLVVINCASASGPFINALSGPNRVVVTSTKSGFQHNFSRFGNFMSTAITDPAADLDKDDQTSLLEAFLYASAQVAEFYEQESRLATEHALIDDTGDALGTPADWFRGVRAVRVAKSGAASDGLRANQLCLLRSDREKLLSPEVRTRRDGLELQIATLRTRKSQLLEDDYYQQLESLFVELARLYASTESPADAAE
jgi:hypothetical protein